MKDLRTLVESIIVKNPDTADDPKYLWIEVLDAQGVRLYPHQRERILSDKVSSPESVMRAKRYVKVKLAKQREQMLREWKAGKSANAIKNKVKDGSGTIYW